MNVNKVLTKDYDKMDTWSIQNEPKFKKAKMNVTSYITKGYENKSNWAICKNEPKTNPNKPNFRPGLLSVVSFCFPLFFAPAIISPDLVQPDKKLSRLLYIGDRYES
jgi:hypothetical protein